MTPEKTCLHCRESKPADLRHFGGHDRTRDGLVGVCRVCRSEQARRWYAERVGRPVAERGPYGSGNREGYKPGDRERGKATRREYNASDLGRAQKALRKPLWRVMGSTFRSRRKLEWLGCSPCELRAHLEEQFQPGMTWDNHGVWHVDHIRPVCAFDPSDPADVLAVNHYTNLRPLWAEDNVRRPRGV